MAGFAPRKWPALFGFDFGADLFPAAKEQFTLHGQDELWKIRRRNFWLTPSFRIIPVRGVVMPSFGLLAGMWLHHVRVEPYDDSVDVDAQAVRSSVTWALGAAAGIHFRRKKVLFGAGLRYLRGGKIKVPDVQNRWVEDGELRYHLVRVGPIHQLTFSLEIMGKFWD